MDNIQQAQAGGYAFSPQRASEQVGVTDSLAGLSSGLGKLLNKYAQIKQGNETDFMQAMVDHAAGTIKEQSWLTPEAYTQGVAYSGYVDKQSNLTAALPDISRKVLDSGGDLDAFKAQLQPVIAELGKSLEESGLSGDALLAAQKQNISFVASAMDTFQKQREVELKQKLNETDYKIINSQINAFTVGNADPAELTGRLGLAFEQIKANRTNSKDADPIGTASNLVGDSVKAYAKRANPATPEGQKAIQAIAAFAGSAIAQGMSPKAYNDIQEVLSTKQQEVMDYNSNVKQQEQVALERAFDAGQFKPTSSDFSSRYKEIQGMVAAGTITSAAGNTLIQRTYEFEKRALKESQDSTVALTGDYSSRTAMFGTDADSKSADIIVKQANRVYSNYDQAARFIIKTGLDTQNGAAVTAGFKQYSTQMDVLFSTDPADITKGQIDGTHIQAYQGYVAQVQALQNSGNKHMLGKALDAIQDKDTRDAVEAYFSTGAKVGANVAFDMKEIQRYKEQIIGARSGGVGSQLTGLKAFTVDDIKSGFFAGHMWPILGEADTGKATSWWNNPSDDVLQKRVDVLNQALTAARPELAAMAAQGQVLVTPTQQIRALRELGRVVPIDTGFVTANKGWKDSLRVGNTDTKLSDELLQRSLEVMRDRFHTKFNGYGGRDFKPENVQMTVVGNELLISATDKSGQRMTPLQRYGTSMVNEAAWQINESRKKNGGALPVGTVQAGSKKLVVTKDWNTAFGDELGQAMAASFVRYEGNMSEVRATDKSRPNVVTTSIGIRMDGTHGDWQRKILEGKKNGTEDQVVGAFVKDYYKNFSKFVRDANLPEAKNLNMTGLTNAYIGLGHAMWQGGQQGGGNAYVSMLKLAQSNPEQAIEQFYKSALFKDIDSTSGGKGKTHPRTQMYIQGLMDVAAVYNARAVAALKK